jgi:predicted metal-dependent hydrolase
MTPQQVVDVLLERHGIAFVIEIVGEACHDQAESIERDPSWGRGGARYVQGLRDCAKALFDLRNLAESRVHHGVFRKAVAA